MKKIAFICVHNSCRSQIAEALCRHYAGELLECYSAGTETKEQINQDAVRLMKQLYHIDMEEAQYSKSISEIPETDKMISMGCHVGCPLVGRAFDERWNLENPTGKSDEEFVKVIQEIEEKVLMLIVVESFSVGYNCAQIVASLFARKHGIEPEQVRRMTCGFGGGLRKGEICGAVTGAIIAIGMRYGNIRADDMQAKTKCHEATVAFEEQFQDREGSIICRNLLNCDLSNNEGMEYAKSNHLFSAICPRLVLTAIQILLEMERSTSTGIINSSHL